jgi:hypothetical protein
VAVGGALPLLSAAAVVLVWGDEFGSAVAYHAERSLQVESVAATPFEVAALLGADVSSQLDSGSWNVVGRGTEAARIISIGVLASAYGLLLWRGLRAEASRPQLAVALLAATLTLSPVLSPQFLLWLLPLSAAVYGLGRENLVLILALVITQLALQHYDDAIGEFHSDFVLRIAARNAVLLLYLFLVSAPIVRATSVGAGDPPIAAPGLARPGGAGTAAFRCR